MMGRRLEAVLADIVAEGHMVQLSIHLDGIAYLASIGKSDDEKDWSLSYGKDPVALAEKRLAELRRLNPTPHHILAGVGMVHIEDGRWAGQYAVGELVREGDQHPFKVVRRTEGQAPIVEFEFERREDAEACCESLTTGAFAPLMCPDSEHEKRMQQDRDAAAEDIRREALASEETV